MPNIRTKKELDALKPTAAERKLIEHSKSGQQCILGKEGICPSRASRARSIRVEILRYLILGGCKDWPVHTSGVWLEGAYISDMLDLNFAKTKGATLLLNCCFKEDIETTSTTFETVHLSGSRLKNWSGGGCTVKGDIFFNGVHSTGLIDLSGAQIGGQLSCIGAKLTASNATSLRVQSATVSGGAFLALPARNGQPVTEPVLEAKGEISFTNSKVGGFYANDIRLQSVGSAFALSLNNLTSEGQVNLSNAQIDGEIRLSGGRITGDLIFEGATLKNPNGHALSAKQMSVEQEFTWKKVKHIEGAVSLNGSHVAVLDDDPDNWPGREELHLDGFTYDRVTAKVATTPDRLKWLRAGSYFDGAFRPQPFTQYAKFLREIGHDSEARRLLEINEGYLREDRRRRRLDPNETPGLNDRQWILNRAATWIDKRIIDPALKWVIGYGHAPFRVLIVMSALIALFWVPTQITWYAGQFAPNSAVIQTSAGWTAPETTDEASIKNPAKYWSEKGEGADWESFSSGAYAMDVVIPIINFGQTDAWAPSTTRGNWGWHLWWLKWVFGSLGWIVTALGAAAITGIVRRD